MEKIDQQFEKKRFGKLSRKGRKVNCEVITYCTTNHENLSTPTFDKESLNRGEKNDTKLDVGELTFNEEVPIISTLPNLGSTCFCNAVIHILRFTPGFLPCLHQITTVKSLWRKGEVPFLLKQLHSLFQELQKYQLIISSKDSDSRSEIVRKILKYFSKEDTGYQMGQQYDAHEFLSWLLRAVACDNTEHLLERKPTKRTTGLDAFTMFRSQFLEGLSRVTVTCLECENIKHRMETFWDLPYEASSDNAKGDGSSGTIFSWKDVCKESIIQGQNKYWCEECLQHCEAKHSIHVINLPQVIVFHSTNLSASNFTYLNVCEKNLQELPVPDILPCINSSCQVPCLIHQYKLYAIIVHIGSTLQSGHYVALLRFTSELLSLHANLCLLQKDTRTRPTTRLRTESGQSEVSLEECCLPSNEETTTEGWIKCDDEIVESYKSSSTSDVLKKLGTSATPSMLFYFKCEVR